MPSTSKTVVAGMSSEAVQAKTGKGWNEWLKLLDKAGAKQWPHKEIAKYLHDECGVAAWWSQMVTVGYEQARGLREPHQTAQGYTANVSRTVGAPLAVLYGTWGDAAVRKKWLNKSASFGRSPLVIRKAIKNKSMRITWVDGKTSVEVNFYAKGEIKSQVTVQHSKLPDAKAVKASKEYWADSLDRMKALL